MADAKLYSAQDIEKLKQKIATYRDTLTTLKSGNSIDDYLFMKSELNGFKMQVSQLEEIMGRMDDKRSVQVVEYEQQIDNFSRQMGSLNQTVEELYQDLSVVMKKLLNERPEKVEEPVPVRDSVKTVNQPDEITSIEETIQKKDSAPMTTIQSSNRPPLFKQLQGLAGKAIDSQSQNIPTAVAPSVSIDIQDNYAELQHFPKQRFPFAGGQSNQLYNRPNRNTNRITAIHVADIVKNPEVPLAPINVDSNPIPNRSPNQSLNPNPNPVLIIEPEKTEPEMTYSEQVALIAPVEEKQAPIIEAKESLIEERLSLQVEKEYLVEELEAPVEVVNEMKRQQHKNKESISLFGFFRKKP